MPFIGPQTPFHWSSNSFSMICCACHVRIFLLSLRTWAALRCPAACALSAQLTSATSLKVSCLQFRFRVGQLGCFTRQTTSDYLSIKWCSELLIAPKPRALALPQNAKDCDRLLNATQRLNMGHVTKDCQKVSIPPETLTKRLYDNEASCSTLSGILRRHDVQHPHVGAAPGDADQEGRRDRLHVRQPGSPQPRLHLRQRHRKQQRGWRQERIFQVVKINFSTESAEFNNNIFWGWDQRWDAFLSQFFHKSLDRLDRGQFLARYRCRRANFCESYAQKTLFAYLRHFVTKCLK